MPEYAAADVRVWGRPVGRVIEEEGTGEITFQYHPDFAAWGLEVSPLNLPLADRLPRRFPELRRSEAFEGLPGVLADSLPDRFGGALIRAHFERLGRGGAVTPIQKLLYVGARGPGALEYGPAEPRTPAIEEALEIRSLVDQARRVIEGRTDEAIAEIIRVGATAGGARPKALVLWNRAEGRVRSGHAEPLPGDEPWIVKFDGVTRSSGGLENVPTREGGPWGRLEYAYSVLARRAGLEMAETLLLEGGDGLAHFMTRRFDRTDAGKLHLHTLGGLLHLDYNVQYQIGYEDYFDAIRALGLHQPAIEEAFRRMVFAVATVNFDDHLKNHAFLMDAQGAWRLAPAYDVSFAKNDAWTRQHQMSIHGKFRDVARRDVLEVAAKFDLRAPDAAAIVDRVLDAVAGWPTEARGVGLDATFTRAIDEELGAARGRLAR